MIERMMKSRNYSHSLRQRYELKINEMVERVRQTEEQRDEVLRQISDSKEHARHEIEMVRSQYDAKLKNLKTQLSDIR